MGLRPSRLSCLAAGLALGLSALISVPGSTAQAQSRFGHGWQLSSTGDLTWTAPHDLPAQNAALEFRADGALIGHPKISPDGRQLRLRLPAPIADPATLAVYASGRRLDAGPTSLRQHPPVTDLSLRSARPAPRTAAAVLGPAAGQTALTRAGDPGRPGPYRTHTSTYTRSAIAIPGMPARSEVEALVISPVGARGKRPIAVLLHGRHEPCYETTPGAPEPRTFWPCGPGWAPVPSYRGYQQAQRLLASQGWITVSISANAINAQDANLDDSGAGARSALIRHHLGLWTHWSSSDRAWAQAPGGVRAGPRPNLSQVLLMGHSRGGEGANRASLDSITGRAPWTIAGQVLFAPTAFGRNPAPGVPTAVILPSCDGDVYDLQGQAYLDESRTVPGDPALRSAVFVVGGNHNFFNTEWTPGTSTAPSFDDWFDPEDSFCGTAVPTRLTPGRQLAVGSTYLAAAARGLVLKDKAALSLLDGSPVRAPSAGKAIIFSHALGGNRAPVLMPGTQRTLRTSGAVSAHVCEARADVGPRLRPCAGGRDFGALPHFAPDRLATGGHPARPALEVSWKRPTGQASLTFARATSLARAQNLALRVITDPGVTSGLSFELRDSAGRRARLARSTIESLPGRAAPGLHSDKLWAQEIRLNLRDPAIARSGINLNRITGLALTPTSSQGRLWLLDAWAQSSGLSTAAVPGFVRADVRSVRTGEGSTVHTVKTTITLTGSVRAPATLWVYAQGDIPLIAGALPAESIRAIRLRPGMRSFTISQTVLGNRIYTGSRDLPITLTGGLNVVAGGYAGALRIREDDPRPSP